jgi:phosphoribosylformylglycinamidine synthase
MCTFLTDLERYSDNVLEDVFKQKYVETEKIKEPIKAEIPLIRRLSLAPLHTLEPIKNAKPRVLIPVFPGTNGEYDMADSFKNAGAEIDFLIVRNLTLDYINESVEKFVLLCKNCHIIALPGGFSAGDEPEGSAKFITAFFRNPKVTAAVTEFLDVKKGLMLGICNGFQALVKLGLLPYGRIQDTTNFSLTFNKIGRHQASYVITRISSQNSAWLNYLKIGKIFTAPISHGEGRFCAETETDIINLMKSGQIASQYCTRDGIPTSNIEYNPPNSMQAIEAVLSPDGRIFGKMGHSERVFDGCAKNINNVTVSPIFRSGVEYWTM